MLRTFEAPFDHHSQDGGRRKFRELADSLAERFSSRPLIVDDPVFTYAASRRSRLDRIADLDDSQPAIVYLSNVVMHASVLIVGEGEIPELKHPLQYDSVATFLESPYVRGYRIDQVKASLDDTSVVISDFARFQDDSGDLPDKERFRVLARTAEIFVCNVFDFGHYFTYRTVSGEHPSFFLPADSGVDYQECANQMDRYTLREYLLDRWVPFATLGDDHMDDDFAVSYGMDCWRSDEDQWAFVR